MNRYKVWVTIEEVNEDGDFTGKTGADFGVLPDPMGEFDTVEEAIVRQGEVNSIFGSDPEHSDARPDSIMTVQYLDGNKEKVEYKRV